jgi:hypothetical protein
VRRDEPGSRWDHGGWTFVDGMDDFGVVYSTEIPGGDPEIGVLALDDN